MKACFLLLQSKIIAAGTRRSRFELPDVITPRNKQFIQFQNSFPVGKNIAGPKMQRRQAFLVCVKLWIPAFGFGRKVKQVQGDSYIPVHRPGGFIKLGFDPPDLMVKVSLIKKIR